MASGVFSDFHEVENLKRSCPALQEAPLYISIKVLLDFENEAKSLGLLQVRSRSTKFSPWYDTTKFKSFVLLVSSNRSSIFVKLIER